MDIPIGKVTQYYDAPGMAIIEVVSQTLRLGDVVRISGKFHDLTQQVSVLRIEYQSVDSVPAGETCGLKVDEPVEVGDDVFLVSH
jgi:hypothetical protein